MLVNTIYSEASARDKAKAAFLKALGINQSWEEPAWPLPNLQESTEAAFWSWRTSYSFNAEAWTSQRRYEGQWGHLLIYWLNQGHLMDGGFAVLVLRNDYPASATIRYFEWRACPHDFKSKTIGNCLTRYACAKCGVFYDVDSSG